MPRKKKQPEEPLEQAKEEKSHKDIIWPVEKDNVRKEIDDIEHIGRMVNIKHNTPGIIRITKTVVYDYISKKIIKAEYKVGVK